MLFVALFMTSAEAQRSERSDDNVKTNVIYGEILGPALAAGFSLNYDFRFSSKSQAGFGMRVGFGGYASADNSAFAIPVMFNNLIGNDEGKHFLELGLGATWYYGDDPFFYLDIFDDNGEENSSTIFGALQIGYRKQPRDGGFSFRAGITPFFGLADDYEYNNGREEVVEKFIFWPLNPHVSFGFSF